MFQQGETQVSPLLEGLLAKYGAVLLGVSIGTAAKYGLSMGEGRRVTKAEIISDVLLVPFMCLVAAFVGTRLGADPMMMTTVSAFIAISSDRLIRLMRERFVQKVAEQIQVLQQEKGETRQIAAIEQSAAHVRDGSLNAPTSAENMVRILPPNTPLE